MGRARHRPVVLLGGERHRCRTAEPSQLGDQLDRRRRSAASCGVIAHGRPSNSDSLAASGPERSLPAIGWLPT